MVEASGLPTGVARAAELKGKTAGKAGPSSGKKIQACVVCSRRGFNLRQMAVSLTVGKLGRSWLDGQMIGDPITLQVGDWVHYQHLSEEVPYDHAVADAIGYSAAADQRRAKVEAFFKGRGEASEKET